MHAESAPKHVLTKEALPDVEFSSSREVEASIKLPDEEEQHRLAAVLKEKSVTESEQFCYKDTRIFIHGFEGVLRIREITPAHPDQHSVTKFEWAVKVFKPRDGLAFAKAPLEYQGVAQSRDEAIEILERIMQAFGHEFVTQKVENFVQTRTIYTLENGVTADINVCTWKNGHTLTPPSVTSEFERPVPEDATDAELAHAEEEILRAAESLGIPKERLSSSRGLSDKPRD